MLSRYWLIIIVPLLIGARLAPESEYQGKFCTGVQEYVLPDKTRIDCLTYGHAIEVEFANKWAEAIGQSLYYARSYNDQIQIYNLFRWVQPGIAIIVESNKDCKYVKRLRYVYYYDIWEIGPYTCTKDDY